MLISPSRHLSVSGVFGVKRRGDGCSSMAFFSRISAMDRTSYWVEEPVSNFVVRRIGVRLKIHGYHLMAHVNSNNIIDHPNSLEENALIEVSGSLLSVHASIPNMAPRSPTNDVQLKLAVCVCHSEWLCVLLWGGWVGDLCCVWRFCSLSPSLRDQVSKGRGELLLPSTDPLYRGIFPTAAMHIVRCDFTVLGPRVVLFRSG